MSIKITVDTCTYGNHLWVAFVCDSRVCVQQFRALTLSIGIVAEGALKTSYLLPSQSVTQNFIATTLLRLSTSKPPPKKPSNPFVATYSSQRTGESMRNGSGGRRRMDSTGWLAFAIGAGWFASVRTRTLPDLGL
ncbi:hypothetical protein BDM02DRAFT_3122576 [Thelephora ganbajun]|uniref:Uncharacterized protein n=1 Tax=Thelephora ganbajun TaxID=370292 RepID=A0ACB6Z2S2_THEGA|nr:hypothetical protein BDM02DRAFT_3122576 [Thelephora ganbajun]